MRCWRNSMKKSMHLILIMLLSTMYVSSCRTYVNFDKFSSIADREFTSPNDAKLVINDLLDKYKSDLSIKRHYESHDIIISVTDEGIRKRVTKSFAVIDWVTPTLRGREIHYHIGEETNHYQVDFSRINKVSVALPGAIPWPWAFYEIGLYDDNSESISDLSFIDDSTGSLNVFIKNTDRNKFLAALYYLCPKLHENK